MGFKLTGNGGTDAEVESTMRTLRVTQRPGQVLGSYRLASFTGLMTGIAANGTIFSMRWTDATNLCAIKSLKVGYAVITGFTAAQELGFDAVVARGFTASDSTQTQLVLTGNNQKKRTSLATSLFAATDVRISGTGAITAGTRTLDAQPVMASAAKTLAAAATVQDARFEALIDMTDGTDYPIVLAQNEGLVVRNSVLMGAAGTVRGFVEVVWDEVATY